MEITKKNFDDQLDNITKDLKTSCFVAFDAEFTAILSGECFKHRLFDTNEERYDKIKTEVSNMIMTQVGLTVFRYERDMDMYVATGYTFHLCPQVFSDVDQSFIFQASTLKFLRKHNFDFNKFTYEGLPYLSKAEELNVRKHLQDKTLFNDLTRVLDMDDEKQLQKYCSEVSKWLTTSEEETMYLDVESPILRYLIHNEVRFRFPNVLTTDSLGNSKKVLIYRSKHVEGANSAPMAVLEDNLLSHLLGFSQIIALLETYQKPIVGHNMFLDIVLLHSQFIGPLPDNYSKFKKNINNMFPKIFDTKYISHQMAKKLSFDDVWKSNALQDLYEFFSEGKCKKLQKGVNLIQLSSPFDVKQTYHEAGWDSFCSGYCFVRLGHWAACENSGKYRPVGPTEKLSALAPYCNKINVIRGAVPYMNVVDKDPPSHRPGLLHIKSLNERAINIGKNECIKFRRVTSSNNATYSRKICQRQTTHRTSRDARINCKVASTLASFGSIDVKACGRKTALIAANSQYTVDKILKNFKESQEYRVTVYKHSLVGRVAMWSGALITGSFVIYLLHKKVKSIA